MLGVEHETPRSKKSGQFFSRAKVMFNFSGLTWKSKGVKAIVVVAAVAAAHFTELK